VCYEGDSNRERKLENYLLVTIIYRFIVLVRFPAVGVLAI
jgi:hypothetical protein